MGNQAASALQSTVRERTDGSRGHPGGYPNQWIAEPSFRRVRAGFPHRTRGGPRRLARVRLRWRESLAILVRVRDAEAGSPIEEGSPALEDRGHERTVEVGGGQTASVEF